MPRRSRRARVRVAAGLLWRRGRVLLMQRHRSSATFARKWEFPGGKLRRGETPRRALKRELKEELKIRAAVGPLVARYRHRYPNGLQVELWFFHVRGYRGRLPSAARLRAKGVAEQVRWVPRAAMPRYDLLAGDALLVAGLAGGSGRRPGHKKAGTG